MRVKCINRKIEEYGLKGEVIGVEAVVREGTKALLVEVIWDFGGDCKILSTELDVIHVTGLEPMGWLTGIGGN